MWQFRNVPVNERSDYLVTIDWCRHQITLILKLYSSCCLVTGMLICRCLFRTFYILVIPNSQNVLSLVNNVVCNACMSLPGYLELFFLIIKSFVSICYRVYLFIFISFAIRRILSTYAYMFLIVPILHNHATHLTLPCLCQNTISS